MRVLDSLFAPVASEPAGGDVPPAVWPEPQLDATLRRLTEELLQFGNRAASSSLGEWKQFARDAEALFTNGTRDLQLGIGLAIAWTVTDEFPGLATGLGLLSRIVGDFSQQPKSQPDWEIHARVAGLLDWSDRCLTEALLGVRLIRGHPPYCLKNVLECQAFEARDPSDWQRYCRSRGRSEEKLRPWHDAELGVSREEFDALSLQVREAQQALTELTQSTTYAGGYQPELPSVGKALRQVDQLVSDALEKRQIDRPESGSLEKRAPARLSESGHGPASSWTSSSARVEELLVPISPERPCGECLRYDPLMTELEDALKRKPDLSFGPTTPEAQSPDWEALEQKCADLWKQSRDLYVGIVLACCWLKREGFSGFLDGLRLVEGLLKRFWHDVHPVLDPEDNFDPTERMNILGYLTAPAGQNTYDWLGIVDHLATAPLCRPDGAPPVTIDILDAAMARTDGRVDATALGPDIDAILPASRVVEHCEAASECVDCVERIREFWDQTATPGIDFTHLRNGLRRMIGTLEKYNSRRPLNRAEAVRLLTEACGYFSSQEPKSPANPHLKQALVMVSSANQSAPDSTSVPNTKRLPTRSSRKSGGPAAEKPKPGVRRRRK